MKATLYFGANNENDICNRGVELLLRSRAIATVIVVRIIDVVGSCNCCYEFVALLLWIRIELLLL